MTNKRTCDSPGGAGRIAPGDTITARELTTIQSERILLPAPGILTHLQFRRYAGCPICNLHLHSMARRHDEIVAAGIQEIVVFHSAAADMLPYQGQLPFAAVADPGRKLYGEFGVTASPRAVLHPKAWTAPLNPRVYPIILRGIRPADRLPPGTGIPPSACPRTSSSSQTDGFGPPDTAGTPATTGPSTSYCSWHAPRRQAIISHRATPELRGHGRRTAVSDPVALRHK